MESYPLHWPESVPRTPPPERKRANFGKRNERGWRRELTLHQALKRLFDEVRRFTKPGHDWRIYPHDVIVSTNVKVRQDGLPYSSQRAPNDPGVSIWYELDEEPLVFPCDVWDRVADNIAGVAAGFGAIRGLERWVNAYNVKAAFRGFAVLPETIIIDWRQVMQLQDVSNITPKLIDDAYRRLAKVYHPDRGGTDNQMADLNRARDDAREAIA